MRQYNHYFKKCPYDLLDIYRLGRLFEINNNELFHAVKKLIASGKRGSKNNLIDVTESIDSSLRHLEMELEDLLISNPDNNTVVNNLITIEKIMMKMGELRKGIVALSDAENLPVSSEFQKSEIESVLFASKSQNQAREIDGEDSTNAHIAGQELNGVKTQIFAQSLIDEKLLEKEYFVMEIKDEIDELSPSDIEANYEDEDEVQRLPIMKSINFCINPNDDRCPKCNSVLFGDNNNNIWCSGDECDWTNLVED